MILKIGEWVLARGLPLVRPSSAPLSATCRSRSTSRRASSTTRSCRKMVARALKETGLPPRLLELEITESTAMQQTDAALRTLKRLKQLGVSIAIDDFGTGYSSLSYLRRFPVDKVKIDRSFVAEVPADRDQGAIVSAIVALAHALQIQVVAEGVETEAQRAFLKSLRLRLHPGLPGRQAGRRRQRRERVRLSAGPSLRARERLSGRRAMRPCCRRWPDFSISWIDAIGTDPRYPPTRVGRIWSSS